MTHTPIYSWCDTKQKCRSLGRCCQRYDGHIAKAKRQPNIKDSFERAAGGIQSTNGLSYLSVALQIYLRDYKVRTGQGTDSSGSIIKVKKGSARRIGAFVVIIQKATVASGVLTTK